MPYLWMIKRASGDVEYDENEAFLVCADYSDQARQIAASASDEKNGANRGDENSRVWLDFSRTDLSAIGEALLTMDGTEMPHGVVMRSFRAG